MQEVQNNRRRRNQTNTLSQPQQEGHGLMCLIIHHIPFALLLFAPLPSHFCKKREKKKKRRQGARGKNARRRRMQHWKATTNSTQEDLKPINKDIFCSKMKVPAESPPTCTSSTPQLEVCMTRSPSRPGVRMLTRSTTNNSATPPTWTQPRWASGKPSWRSLTNSARSSSKTLTPSPTRTPWLAVRSLPPFLLPLYPRT